MTATATWNDVLDRLMEEDPSADYATLRLWCARFPAFQQELTSYFSFVSEQEASTDPVVLDEERLRNRSISKALALAHERLTYKGSSAPVAPKSAADRLSQRMKLRGLDEAQFAARCRLDVSVIVKLDRRRIAPMGSIPGECLDRIGAVLNESRRSVEEMICGPPLRTAAAGLRKARQKTELPTETFEQAIRESTLPDVDRVYWLSIIAAAKARP
jgi:hypothetical protein